MSIVGIAACTLAAMGWASEAEDSDGPYQTLFINQAIEKTQCKVDLTPTGKTVESIRAYTIGSITEIDPYPDFMELVHITTKEDVAARELLFDVGEQWNDELAQETERNILNNFYTNVVKVIPCRGSSAQRVSVLVVLKDLWSLRTNITALSVVGPNLEAFGLQFGEYNLLGRNKTAAVNFEFDQSTYTLGGIYYDPRLSGSRWTTSIGANAILRKTTGAMEGGTANFSIGRPLYSLSTPWAWGLSMDYQRDTFRLYRGGYVATASINGETLPIEYGESISTIEASLTRSWGYRQKTNLTGGWRGSLRGFSNSSIGGISAASVTEFNSRYLPRTENAGILFAKVSFYEARYKRFFDLDSYVVPEDIRLGPNASIELAGSLPAFGFSSSFFSSSLTAGWNWSQGESLLTLSSSGGLRFQPEAGLSSPWVNRSVNLSAKYFSPYFGDFRLVGAARLLRRDLDTTHAWATLGGIDALRGYPTAYDIGGSSWGANLEIRTRALKIFTARLGAAAYLDVGDAFDSPSQLAAHWSLGAGLRIVLPEFNRRAIRMDFAMPLEALGIYQATYFVLTFGQAI